MQAVADASRYVSLSCDAAAATGRRLPANDGAPASLGPFADQLCASPWQQLWRGRRLLLLPPTPGARDGAADARPRCSTYAKALLSVSATHVGLGLANCGAQLLLTSMAKQSVSSPVNALNLLNILADVAESFGRLQAHFARDQEDPAVVWHHDVGARRAKFSRAMVTYGCYDGLAQACLLGAVLAPQRRWLGPGQALCFLAAVRGSQAYSQIRQYGFWYCIKPYFDDGEVRRLQVAVKHAIDAWEIGLNRLLMALPTYLAYNQAVRLAAGSSQRLGQYALASVAVGAVLTCAPKLYFWRLARATPPAPTLPV